jgi:MFS superfamily sulfate permease-like transporter
VNVLLQHASSVGKWSIIISYEIGKHSLFFFTFSLFSDSCWILVCFHSNMTQTLHTFNKYQYVLSLVTNFLSFCRDHWTQCTFPSYLLISLLFVFSPCDIKWLKIEILSSLYPSELFPSAADFKDHFKITNAY